MLKPPTVAQILDRLRRQKPVPKSIIQAQIRLRWLATVAIALLLPCALAMMLYTHSWAWAVPGAAIFLLAMAGLIALGVAYAANRREGVQVQWGLSKLTDSELEEFVELAAKYPAIEQVVSDAWLEGFVKAGSHLLGRDLVLLRTSVRHYEHAVLRSTVVATAG